MTLVRIFDLIGADIAGRKADIRSRRADGSLFYEHRKKGGPLIVTMQRVRIRRDKSGKWMRWEWNGRGLEIGLSCGFSGVVMDGARELEYHIEMEDAGR